MILRKASASAWTKDLDDGMNQWLSQYIDWLENNPLALQEKASTKFVPPLISPDHCRPRSLLATMVLSITTKSPLSIYWLATTLQL